MRTSGAVAYRTAVVPAKEAPVLVDDDEVIQGSADIFAYIDDLRQLKADWLKDQSDACYLD